MSIQTSNPEIIQKIGIITFSIENRDYLKNNLTIEDNQIFIGTVEEWYGNEKEIMIVDCAVTPENMTIEDINTALTRGKDYLFLFGDYDLWKISKSPIQSLLYQPGLYKERLVLI